MHHHQTADNAQRRPRFSLRLPSLVHCWSGQA